MSDTSPNRERVTKSKVMITVRLDPDQYNKVLEEANANQMSLNEHCLHKLDVCYFKRKGKVRGRIPKPRIVTEDAK